MQDAATETPRRVEIGRLRESYPTFRVEDARAIPVPTGVRLEFSFSAGDTRFRPTVELTGLRPEELAQVGSPTARRLIRALAIVEAFSYWKAFCSPVIEVGLPAPAAAEAGWWNSFWPGAMGEFFYRNNINFTVPGFLDIRPAADIAPVSSGIPGEVHSTSQPATRATESPLVMFSGGKDSLALTLAVRPHDISAVDFFLYNPTPGQRSLAESLTNGGRILELHREILPELLALNADGHPNGHTPYSAYLAIAAILAGYLRGSPHVLAGNSRSDDEPNVESYLDRPINHQWTKSYEFEAALQDYGRRWLPDAPLYSSPLRPLFELQIIASLSADVDAYLRTASCNRTKGKGWCRTCAKCAWVFLATSVLFGQEVAIRKTDGDMFADASLSGLYQQMAGLVGSKPFECTGTEDEVRAAIHATGRGRDFGGISALAECLRHPAVASARPLRALLTDWGRDDLVPASLVEQVRGVVLTSRGSVN